MEEEEMLERAPIHLGRLCHGIGLMTLMETQKGKNGIILGGGRW